MSSTALKLLALGLMLLDHIYEFIPGMPPILTVLGRISAPVFFFCTVWGFHYTRSRKIYLLRLYDCSVVMGLMDCLLNQWVGEPYTACRNNIFSTLFLVCLFIFLWERWETPRRRALAVLAFWAVNECARLLCGALLGSVLVPAMESGLGLTRNNLFQLLRGFLPNFYHCEGGLWAVAMGMVLSFCKDSRRKICLGYGAYCLAYFLSTLYTGWVLGEADWASYLFRESIQWMQVLALPFMLCYSGRRGRNLKYLFYVFYPVHIALLFCLGNLMAGKF